MAAVEFSLEMTASDLVTIRFTVRDKSGAIVDLTGASFTANISSGFGTRSKPAPIGAKILSPDKTIGMGITVPDPVNGIVEVTLETADSANLEGTYFFQLQMVSAASETATIAKGSIAIARSIL